MPWTLETFQKKQWYQSIFVWIGVAAVVSLGLIALPRAQRLYHRWSEARRVTRAAEALASGQYQQAIMDAKVVIARNPHNVEATRIIAKSLEAMNAPQALLVRRRLDSLTSNDVENALAIAAGSWKAGDPIATERALSDVPAAARDSARYHELAARVAASRQDTAGALEHWQEALRRDPANPDFTVELAATRLKSKLSGDHEAGLQQLERLAPEPATRLAALRALLNDAGTRNEKSRSVELSTALIAESAATFADQLKHLGILRNTLNAGFASYLATLQETSTARPEHLFALLSWMNQHDLALAVPEWAAKLSPESLAIPQIRAVLAAADARASNWIGLKARLENESWAELEFLRLAHLTRALERLGDENGAVAAWANAVAAAQASPRQLEVLGKTVLEWGWSRKAEDVLWKLAASEICPRWAADFLWSAARRDADSARLYEAARVILKADPKSIPARNNFVTLSLLTGHDGDSPHQMAADLYQQQPTDPFIATTYGLALYQKGRAEEAVQLLSKYSAEQLHQPLIALYQGIFLAGAGRFAEAQEYLTAAASAPMLPEEKALFTKAQGGAPAAPTAALDRRRSDTAQIYTESRQAFLAEPRNVAARSNYILLALLTDRGTDSATQLARALHQENLENPAAAAIYGLALYQQGKVEEAAALMKAFAPEKLHDPAVALYPGLFLAAAGRKAEAAPFLAIAAQAPLLAEEKTLLAKAQAGAPAPAATINRTATAPPAAPTSTAVALDRTRRDTRQLFNESRQVYLDDPKNLLARCNYLLLALLTGQSADSARPLARSLHRDQPADPTAASIYGLSLFQEGKAGEAVALMETLKPEQLREPIAALYYGCFLAGSDFAAKAPEFLAVAEKATLLPEEQALLAAAKPKRTPITIPVP